MSVLDAILKYFSEVLVFRQQCVVHNLFTSRTRISVSDDACADGSSGEESEADAILILGQNLKS